jgi:hypothetical protein
MRTRLNIVARYNENLDWLKDIKGDILIYNKGDEIDCPFRTHQADNYGRESETYVRAIIEYYDQLHKFDDIVFLQGHPFDHCPDLLEMLEYYPTNSCIGLAYSAARHKLPKDNFVFDIHKSMIDHFFQVMRFYSGDEIPNQCTDISFLQIQNEDGEKLEKKSEVYQIMYVCLILGISFKDIELEWPCGAQYIVDTKYILNKSKDWWQNLHSLIEYVYNVIEIGDLGYILERLWPLIWLHSDK